LAELALGRRPTDQQLMADAATWRQHYRPPTAWQCVGGFADAEPLRDLDDADSVPRSIGRRRDYAPGARVVARRASAD
jgi:hypothetical protein